MKSSLSTRRFSLYTLGMKKRSILITVAVFLLFIPWRGGFAVGIPLTHVPGRPPTGKFHNIPTHPSAKTLSRVVLKPDLTVEKQEGQNIVLR